MVPLLYKHSDCCLGGWGRGSDIFPIFLSLWYYFRLVFISSFLPIFFLFCHPLFLLVHRDVMDPSEIASCHILPKRKWKWRNIRFYSRFLFLILQDLQGEKWGEGGPIVSPYFQKPHSAVILLVRHFELQRVVIKSNGKKFLLRYFPE